MHGFSTVAFGSMRRQAGDEAPLTAPRRAFAEALGVDPERLSYAGCVHGTRVARVDEPAGVVDGVDALVTDRPGLPLLSLFADCIPLVVYSSEPCCVGLGHAGWRGTAGGLAQALVAVLAGEYGCQPARLVAGIGPGICGACYEVGEEVAARFSPGLVRRSAAGRPHLDLVEANRLALLDAGLDADRIQASGVCTKESDFLFSHRGSADGRRFAGLVALL